MKRLIFAALFCLSGALAQRVVILKVDGLGQDLLASSMEERDTVSGKSQLPWLTHIFAENGTVYENFYTRGISLSAPSWSILDTGHHALIRGNVEYDRYTGEVYDYLNFFPFYIGYARKKLADMPGVEVLDRAGVPLLTDHFKVPQVYESFQLFQRGVRWQTLQAVLQRRFSSKAIFSMLEGDAPSYDELLQKQMLSELEANLAKPEDLYLDLYITGIDHQGHATNEPAALERALRELDAIAGKVWTAIQSSPLASQTAFIMVSDHGMNNDPAVISQTFGLTDLLNSPEGGAHHVLTNREQLSDFKLMGLNPLLSRVENPSNASFYLAGQADRYPTAWLDIDGNERAALHLRNSDLNKIHILLLQLARSELTPEVRKAAALCLRETIDNHRSRWTATINELGEEMAELKTDLDNRKAVFREEPKRFNRDQVENGERRALWRTKKELDDRQQELDAYTSYANHLKRLLAFTPDSEKPSKVKISGLVPEMSLGDNNTPQQLRHYLAGPAASGLVCLPDGRLDEEKSFRYVDYPKLFNNQHARNKPQKKLSSKPVDFIAMLLDDHSYLLYADEDKQLEIKTDDAGRIAAHPVSGSWRAGLPLEIYEDRDLLIPPGVDKDRWLNDWHNEKEWFAALHKTRYSNGLIGVIEELSPIAPLVPGQAGISPAMLRYERRRRQLVQPDLHIFAADHWNFNTRFPNPGGNHGSFLRISTHSVWMMAGAGIPKRQIAEPIDSLSFAPTVLALAGRNVSGVTMSVRQTRKAQPQ